MGAKVLSTREQAAAAIHLAEQRLDEAIAAKNRAVAELEMAREELQATDGKSPAEIFVDRLRTWFGEQPDVSDLDEVGDGIFGMRIAGVGDVSLMINRTGESHFTG